MIMKKDVQLKFALLLMLFVASFAACDDDDEKIDAVVLISRSILKRESIT